MYLILAFLFGLSYGVYTGKTLGECYGECPAGYYKTDSCAEIGKPHRCEKCSGNTYTDIPNNVTKCLRCSPCRTQERKLKVCLFNSDTQCDCQDGHYYFDRSKGDCRPCPTKDCNEIGDPQDCRRKCKSYPPTPKTRPSTTFPTPTKNKSSNGLAVDPVLQHSMHWFYLVAVAVVILLVLSWLLLLNRNPLRYLACCPTNKNLEGPVEDLKNDEQHSHQGCSPTTVALTVFENTPMMPVSQGPATEDHLTPAHVSPLEPNTERQASRQDEQSEHWPAIILYAIIKEVPLRRWKEFLRLLSVADQQLERVELEAGLGMGSIEKQYQMLRLWSQRPSASLNDVFSALCYMELPGCAQLLQESLENLQQRLNQNKTEIWFNCTIQEN